MKRAILIWLLALSGCTHVRFDPRLDQNSHFIACAAWNPDEHRVLVVTMEACKEAIETVRERNLSEGRDPGEVNR